MSQASSATIRVGHLADAESLSDLAHRTFRETYAAQTDPGDLDAFLADAYRVDDVRDQLADERHRWLVVEDAGASVGFAHLVVGESVPPVKGERPVLLAEIYLERSQQGRGVGAALMQRCISEASWLGGDVLWLGVWEHNARAIGFYRKSGFVEVGDAPFTFGSEQQRDIIMSLPLPPGAPGQAGGRDGDRSRAG